MGSWVDGLEDVLGFVIGISCRREPANPTLSEQEGNAQDRQVGQRGHERLGAVSLS